MNNIFFTEIYVRNDRVSDDFGTLSIWYTLVHFKNILRDDLHIMNQTKLSVVVTEFPCAENVNMIRRTHRKTEKK